MALFRRWRSGLRVAGIHPLALPRRWRAGGGRNTPLDPPEEMEGLGLEEHTLRPYSGDGGLGGERNPPLDPPQEMKGCGRRNTPLGPPQDMVG